MADNGDDCAVLALPHAASQGKGKLSKWDGGHWNHTVAPRAGLGKIVVATKSWERR